MASNINSDIVQADAQDRNMDGGLDLKSDSSSVASPKTTRADNCWYITPGQVKQLPAFSTQLSTLAQQPLHVYNTHSRDSVEGTSNGDVMVHGEFRDAPASATNLLTTPLWAHNLGQTLTPSQPMLPYTAKTRQLGASASPGVQTAYPSTLYDANINSVHTAKQDIAGADGRRRYAIVTNGFATTPGAAGSKTNGITGSFGYLDEQGEVVPTSATPALLQAATVNFMQVHALPGTTNWAFMWVSTGVGVNVQIYDFSGTPVGGVTTVGTFTSSSLPQPFDAFQHSGSLYFAYYDKTSSGGAWNTYLYNVSSASSAGAIVLGGVTATPTTPMCAFSPTPAATTGTSYFGHIFQSTFWVIPVTGGVIVAAPVASFVYPQPTTAASTTGLNQATGAAVFHDALGYGPTSNISFVVYRLFNEKVTAYTISSAVPLDAQSVAIDRYNFVASSGTLTTIGTTVFRAPSGVQLACKAFATNPAFANFAGPSAAKGTLCPVRIGSVDLSYYTNFTGQSPPPLYGQPTYFLIDHQARIVGRWFDGAAPAARLVGVLPTAFPTGLGSALINMPASSDMATVRIQVPSWSLIQAQYASAVNVAVTGTFTAPNNTPINPVFVPAVFDMQYQSQGIHVPPIRGGSHQYVSGCMTALHDGRLLTEANFHTAAFNPSADFSQFAGNLGPLGTYYYTIVWTWIDALGRKHRSQPSLAASVVVTGAGNVFPGAEVIVCAPLGNKWSSGEYPTCEVYRTLSNATDGNSYLIYTVAVPPMGAAVTPNAGAAVAIPDNTFTDSYTNSSGTPIVGTLSAQPRLYTSINANNVSNVYASSAPPPFVWMVATKGRAAGIAYIQGEARLYYSSVDSFGIPLEWNPFNYATIPGEIGEARSVEAVDDKFVILGARANAVMNGDGPPASNAAGIPSPGDGFSSVTPLPTPAGVLGTGSPVRIPAGILYQGPSGIVAIGRDLGITPVGALVDPLTGRQIGNPGQIFGRATLLPSLQSVVWANTFGPPLVFNYLTNAWSTWPLLSYAQSLVQRLNGDIWVAMQPMTPIIAPASTSAAGADLGILTANTFAYNSPAPTSPALVLESGWVNVGKTQAGTGWLREMALYGEFIGNHILQIEQGVNYAPYGPPIQFTVTSTSSPSYEFQVRPPTSTVRSARYRITLLPSTTLSAQYQLATISDMALFAGAKQGTARLSGATSQ